MFNMIEHLPTEKIPAMQKILLNLKFNYISYSIKYTDIKINFSHFNVKAPFFRTILYFIFYILSSLICRNNVKYDIAVLNICCKMYE